MDAFWQSFLNVLPPWMRESVDRLGRQGLRQLRLRLGTEPRLEFQRGLWQLPQKVTQEDLDFCVNAASNYSPWSVASARQGYLTLSGGHRMGLCGEAVVKDGAVTGFRHVSSLCLRAARDLSGIAPEDCGKLGSTLILGAPGWGKTTLLRDLCRRLAGEFSVAVVDERGELFPEGFSRGPGLDVLTLCGKETGMEMVLRTMAPDYIGLDEITAEADVRALIRAAGCGVRLLATAHAASLEDLYSRPCYRTLAQSGIFQTVLLLSEDKTFHRERMESWSTNGSAQSWSSAAAAGSASP